MHNLLTPPPMPPRRAVRCAFVAPRIPTLVAYRRLGDGSVPIKHGSPTPAFGYQKRVDEAG